MLALLVFAALLAGTIFRCIIKPLYIDRESKIPGPISFALTKWRLAFEDWRGTRTRKINSLHQQYGLVVRIGPTEVHCNSLSALRTIYGAGSCFERTTFYRMFDAYGKQNLFTFHSVKDHSQRKKLVVNAYSKSLMLRGPAASMIQLRVSEYMALIESRGSQPHEIFSSLHYFSLDTITHFLYGAKYGGTSALTGHAAHRELLNDIVDPARRRLSSLVVHLAPVSRWLYSRTGLMERLVSPLLPMQKPATYTGIRNHALQASQRFQAAGDGDRASTESPIINQLWKSHESIKGSGAGALDALDIASECADHLLAGIDTTSDTLMFLIWAFSRPQHSQSQQRLIEELRALPEDVFQDGVPRLEAVDALPYLNAVIRETLRTYAPLPATEPRSLSADCVIEGYTIPAGTVVGVSPYSLHRNAEVFKSPLTFDPERWFGPAEQVAAMNRWFWAFSSGGRMCIGLQ